MSSSSNLRYNILNSLEDALFARGVGVGRLGSVALRLANNWAGAAQWVALTRLLRLDEPYTPLRQRRGGGEPADEL